jgi:hypothetical protein
MDDTVKMKCYIVYYKEKGGDGGHKHMIKFSINWRTTLDEDKYQERCFKMLVVTKGIFFKVWQQISDKVIVGAKVKVQKLGKDINCVRRMMMHWDEIISNLHLSEKSKFEILKIRIYFF